MSTMSLYRYGNEAKHTARPRSLLSCIPVLSVKAEYEEVEVGIEGHAW